MWYDCFRPKPNVRRKCLSVYIRRRKTETETEIRSTSSDYGCVYWLCDPTWQVTSRSSVMGVALRTIRDWPFDLLRMFAGRIVTGRLSWSLTGATRRRRMRSIRSTWNCATNTPANSSTPESSSSSNCKSSSMTSQDSCAIAKVTAQCALYMGALKIFGTPWLGPRILFPTFSRISVAIEPMNVPTKFEVRSFTCSWDKRR